MDISKYIKQKRAELSMSIKEFSDAIGLGKDGYIKIKDWESQTSSPTSEEVSKIYSFAESFPLQKINHSPSFKFIDLFAGIGGIRIPFQEMGGKCVFSSEWNKFSQKTYHANFGEVPAGDITKISSSEIPDFDILLGGFPCQPFSQAGKHLGFNDTRGTLFFEIERILRDKRPKAFLLENVKQLKGHDGGRTFEVIREHLLNLNYTVSAKILRASDFGVPQIRERLYFVGFNKDYFQIPNEYSFKYPEGEKLPTRLGDILDTSVDSKYTISDKLWEGHKLRKIKNKAAGKGFGFSLFDENSPRASTLSARYYKDGSEILIKQEGKNPRKLTPRECARLQGFPDYFIIPVSDAQAYKQFGNAVAVPVIRAIAKNMLKQMQEFEVKAK